MPFLNCESDNADAFFYIKNGTLNAIFFKKNIILKLVFQMPFSITKVVIKNGTLNANFEDT